MIFIVINVNPMSNKRGFFETQIDIFFESNKII